MKIYLTYCANQSVEYCFWKYFFMVTGVWTEDRLLLSEDNVEPSKSPQLVLLDLKSQDKILTNEYKDLIYCIRGREKLDRKDVIQNEWNNDKSHKKVLRFFFEHNKQEYDIQTWYAMLDIFRGKDFFETGSSKGLWAASWLYHEINYSNSVSWGRDILQICDIAVQRFYEMEYKIRRTWNYQYMRLYCEYLQCAVKKRGKLDYESRARRLLDRCNYFANERGRKPSLDLLTAKICLMIPEKNNDALLHYQSALEYSKRADIYYSIGLIYEKNYKDRKMALLNYQKAYQCDNRNFRAIFKFAMELERRGRWIDAVNVYINVGEIAEKYYFRDQISISQFECDFKSCYRIVQICKRYINDKEMLEENGELLEYLKKNFATFMNFRALMSVLFDKNEGREKFYEMKQELAFKINKTYKD